MLKKKCMNVLKTGRFKLTSNGRLISTHDCYHFVIPFGVKELGADCFENECVKSLEIPESVIKIGEYALCGFKGKHLKLPQSLKEIGDHAFDGSSFYEIRIPGSVNKIGQYAFSFCESLQTVIFEEGLAEIDIGAFSECKKLRRIVFPSTLKKIGDCAFHGCSELREIVFSNGIEEIGELAFSMCESLVSANIPKNAKIGSEAFWEYWIRNGLDGYTGKRKEG